jgi:integrase
MGRKASTVKDYRCMLRRHMGRFFAGKSIEGLDPELVAAYMTTKLAEGLSAKTVTNHLRFLHAVCVFAVRKRWASTNPVAAVDRPQEGGPNPDIRFLGLEELEALLRAVPGDELGPTDRALYLTAAMTGLRQGELVALRWRDVDWPAGLIRVRRTYSRGEWGTPKSRRSSRAVPLADRVAAELERHYQRSGFRGDDQLVFSHPLIGAPYDASKLRERFYEAMKAAGLEHRCRRAGGITFHSLRHTFGTRMAAAGVPMRTLQEWMGHRDFKTTLIYADFAPDSSGGRAWAERAFAPGTTGGTDLSESQVTSQHPTSLSNAESEAAGATGATS